MVWPLGIESTVSPVPRQLLTAQSAESIVNCARRRFLHLAASATALLAVPRIARAQGYPNRPVRIIVPTSAGGANDTVARLMAQWLSERLGQQFMVENRPGGGNIIGTETAVRASPDGYTLLLVNTANTTTLYDKFNFNFIRDIAPIAGIDREPYVVLVHPSVPAKTIPEFIAYAKANPGKLNMASAGSGTGTHISGELFKMMAGVDMAHVPYRGGAPVLTDLLAGQVDVYFGIPASALGHVGTGKLRALAVTSASRSHALPDVPSISEFVPGYEASIFYGLGAPRNTPTEIIDRLNREVNAGLSSPKIKSWLVDAGGAPFSGSPADFGKLIANETEKWAKVIKFAGIKLD
jgi:tripartite-type tricarboxylate transporter receptor subunit TctC